AATVRSVPQGAFDEHSAGPHGRDIPTAARATSQYARTMPTEIAPKLLSWASDIEQNTLDQAATTARLSVVDGHVALMPDAHLGFGATVGSVIPTRSAVIPSAVGVDIGCGMIA